MVRIKRQKRVIFFLILAAVLFFPVIYMLICSVWKGVDAGLSFMSYYDVFLESPGYLVKFWRSLGMCLLISAGRCLHVWQERHLQNTALSGKKFGLL